MRMMIEHKFTPLFGENIWARDGGPCVSRAMVPGYRKTPLDGCPLGVSRAARLIPTLKSKSQESGVSMEPVNIDLRTVAISQIGRERDGFS